jgi:hypothetical protein
MHRFIFLTGLFVLLATKSKAQFPHFSEFGGTDRYIDSSSVTKPYRELMGIGDTISVVGANYIVKDAEAKIEEIEKNKKAVSTEISSSERNRLLIKYDQELEQYNKVIEYFDAINTFAGTPSFWAKVVPVKTPTLATFFFQNGIKEQSGADLFSDIILQGNTDQVALSSEAVSGNLLWFRADLSTTFINNTDTTDREAVGDKVLYGGIINGNILFPLFHSAGNGHKFYIPFGYKLSGDRVRVNDDSSTDNSVIFHELYLSAFLRLPIRNLSLGSDAEVFFNGRLSRFSGSDTFYDKLKNTDSIENLEDPFYLFRATAGVEFNDFIRVAVNFGIAEDNNFSDLQRTTIGIQVDPALLARKR